MSKVVALDGDAAAGKTYVGTRLANELDIPFLDSGWIYRAGCLRVLSSGIPFEDVQAITEVHTNLDMDFVRGGEMQRITCGGYDITNLLNLPEISANVPKISQIGSVREAVRRIQYDVISKYPKGIVVAGRDIGTVLCPDAERKFYLTATAEVRACRRYEQTKQKGEYPDYDAILLGIKERDIMDSTRKESPMRRADDAILIDTTEMNREQVLEQLLGYCYELNAEFRIPAVPIN